MKEYKQKIQSENKIREARKIYMSSLDFIIILIASGK